MQALDWADIEMCDVCQALVPKILKSGHEAWHTELAYLVTASTNRLDRIGRACGQAR